MHDRRRLEEGFDLVELARRLANVVRVGVVAVLNFPVVVDPRHPWYRLRACYDTDDAGAPILTDWIPWIVARAGPDREWWSPEIGEQVVLLSPSGEITQAIALPSLYSAASPPPPSPLPPGDPDKRVTEHSDGATFSYDRVAHRYEITLPAGSRAHITAGTIVLQGATETVTIP